MSARKYAQGTKVSVGRTQEQIRALVIKAGADSYAVGEHNGAAVVTFHMQDRLIRFVLSVPSDQVTEERRRWRALHLVIKAKLEIAREGIESFDSVFLANIVTSEGRTVGERLVPSLQKVVSGSSPLGLLMPGGGS